MRWHPSCGMRCVSTTPTLLENGKFKKGGDELLEVRQIKIH